MRQMKTIIFSDVLVGEMMTLTLTEFEKQYQVDEAFLNEMLDHGLIEPTQLETEKMVFDIQALQRIQSALRLQRDLEVNMPGIGIVLDLMDELHHAREELQILRRQIGDK
jgi:chaperone modulatory protein CbpM